MTFSPGQHVKPKPRNNSNPAFKDEPVPAGVVRAVHPHERGQVLFVGESKRPWPSGYFDLDEGQG